jgi:hypothetical protein
MAKGSGDIVLEPTDGAAAVTLAVGGSAVRVFGRYVVIDPATLAIRARLGKAVGSGALRWTPAGVWTSAHDNQTLSWWSAPKAPN